MFIYVHSLNYVLIYLVKNNIICKIFVPDIIQSSVLKNLQEIINVHIIVLLSYLIEVINSRSFETIGDKVLIHFYLNIQ